MERVDAVVIGAGVVGLAVARRLAWAGREVLILEQTGAIGTGISSRNSEVIHAGIYYPKESLRAGLCVAGRDALYRYCRMHNISHQACGKLIVANGPTEERVLSELLGKARANKVPDIRQITRAETEAMEPQLRCDGALYSPCSGIVDTHGMMLALLGEAEARGAMVAYHSRVTGGVVSDGGLMIDVEIGQSDPVRLVPATIVNAAGLGAVALACSLRNMPPSSIPEMFMVKGSYFSLGGARPFSRLVYPVPSGSWLGVHATIDLAGSVRFGPDFEPISAEDYAVAPERVEQFYAPIRRYYPALQDGALSPDYAGIRPKIYGPGQEVADFRIDGAETHGIDGLINLFGIESPGLTSSLAIAELVAFRLGVKNATDPLLGKPIDLHP